MYQTVKENGLGKCALYCYSFDCLTSESVEIRKISIYTTLRNLIEKRFSVKRGILNEKNVYTYCMFGYDAYFIYSFSEFADC